jgi:hypothetical protein
MGSSLLSTLNLKIQSGSQLDEMFEFIMNFKTQLVKSKKSNEKGHKEEDKSFKISIEKFNSTLKFHREKKELFETKIKSYEDRIKNSNTNEGEKNNMDKDFQFFLKLNETKFTNEMLNKIKNEINLLKNDFLIIQSVLKSILNSGSKNASQINNFKLENYLVKVSSNFPMLLHLKNVKISPKTKERLVTLLYKFKTKINTLKLQKESILNKMLELSKQYHPMINSILSSYNRKIKSFTKVDVKLLRENIKSMSKLLKMHSESVGINQDEIKRLENMRLKKTEIYMKTKKELIRSIRALNKLKKLLLNNYDELKEFMKVRFSKIKK